MTSIRYEYNVISILTNMGGGAIKCRTGNCRT